MRIALGLALLLGQAAPESDPAAAPVNTWVRISPREGKPIPAFGWEGSGAYDPARHLWIHQGGHDGIPQGFALFTCDLTTLTWEQRFPNTSPPGSCCVDGANVYDPAHRRFVRFPGAALGHGWQWSRKVKMKSSPVWLYDPGESRWTNMRPPPYREPEKYSKTTLGSLNAGATYDPVHEIAISFGGQTAGGGTNALFAYDVYANHLERIEGKGPPGPRDGHGIAYDAKNDALVVFGSQYGSDERTWIYRFDTNAWEALELDLHPPARKGKTYSTLPKMAYDSARGICLSVVWDELTGRHETWSLDLASRTWTPMKPAAEPDPSTSRSRNLAYLADQDLFLLELVGKDRGPELWTYRLPKAAPARLPAPPVDLEVRTEARSATLSWSAPGEVTISRAQAEKPWEAKFTKLLTTREARYTDAGLEAGRTYFYRVEGSGGRALGRTQPRVLIQPVVSVLGAGKVEVSWNAHPAPDLAGYNLYRGTARVAAVKKGAPGAWRDNDPEYAEPQVVAVRDIPDLARQNDSPIPGTSFTDTRVDLDKKAAEPDEYPRAVYAYVVRAVNRLGVESGPSPYALTIPAEPEHVLLRENGGKAELKWDPSREKGIAGYLVYELGERTVTRITPEPVRGTAFVHPAGPDPRRYCVVAVDLLGQEGQPSSSAWYRKSYRGFFQGEWHQ